MAGFFENMDTERLITHNNFLAQKILLIWMKNSKQKDWCFLTQGFSNQNSSSKAIYEFIQKILPGIYWPSFSQYIFWISLQTIRPSARASTVFAGEHDNSFAVFEKTFIRFVFLAVKNFPIFTCRINASQLVNWVT